MLWEGGEETWEAQQMFWGFVLGKLPDVDQVSWFYFCFRSFAPLLILLEMWLAAPCWAADSHFHSVLFGFLGLFQPGGSENNACSPHNFPLE